MESQHIFVDYENLQPKEMDYLKGLNITVWIFLGESQSKLPLELVQSLQVLGSSVQYIKITGVGANAVDFHIAYYLGLLVKQYPSDRYHILSKDTGFDPLVRHLISQHISIYRHNNESLLQASLMQAHRSNPSSSAKMHSSNLTVIAPSDSTAKRAKKIMLSLSELAINDQLPTTIAQLKLLVNQTLSESLTDNQFERLILSLTARGVLKSENDKIQYVFSS